MKRLHLFWIASIILATMAAMITAGCNGSLPVTGPVEEQNGSDPAPDPEEEARRAQEEWERLNEELKEKLGPYYVPPPPLEQRENPRVKARALFLTGNAVGYPPMYDSALALIEETELNAVVIDIKDDWGRMTYRSDIERVSELDAHHKPAPIGNIRATLEELHERGIYTIGRIVVYKDKSVLPSKRPEWCIQLKDGGIYRDRQGFAYGNPFIEEIWDYNIAIAKEAALLGFREIQFDYIRFPDDAAYVDRIAEYPGRDGRPKAEPIAAFVRRAQEELAPYNVYVSHDPFGVVATNWGDREDIGQIWEDFATVCDYISPMIYPCHYGSGWFGYSHPDAEPAGVITAALSDAIKRNAPLENPAIIRPWLKSFNHSGLPYGAEEIKAQIDAARKMGIEEYLLWEPRCLNYPREAFITAGEAEQLSVELQERREREGRDLLNRTAPEAAAAYLDSFVKRDRRSWLEAYVLQRTGKSGGYEEGNRYRDWFNEAAGRLTGWEITASLPLGDAVIVQLDLTVTLSGEEITMKEERWPLVRENGVWRISPSEDFLELIEGAGLNR